MEVINIAHKIIEEINNLDMARKLLKVRAESKSLAIAEHDVALAKTIMELRNGVERDIDGEKIKDPAVSIIERVSKGLVWEERQRMDLSEALYKNVIVTIESIKAILNAYQSILRNQTEV